MAYGRKPQFGKKTGKPLNASGLRDLALHYAGRFAVTERKLAEYLTRKIRERGWEDGGQPAAGLIIDIAADMTRLGAVNDASVATMVVGQAARKGFGARRARQMLHIKGVGATDADTAMEVEGETPLALALKFAEKRHLGPFRLAGKPVDAKIMQREVGALVRAGHAIGLAAKIVRAKTVEALEED